MLDTETNNTSCFSEVFTEQLYILYILDILKDWTYNLKKRNGEIYKEYTVKSI